MRVDYSVNEGAGDRVELGGRVLYLCAVAEKMTSPFELRVHGRSGHAVDAGDRRQRARQGGGLHRAAGGVQPGAAADPRDGSASSPPFSATCLGAADALEAARAVDPLAAELLEPLLAATISPTMVHASDLRNVIPALCTVGIDCRLLPGQTPAEASARSASCSGRATTSWSTSRREAAPGLAATARCGMPSSRSSPPRSRAPRPRPMCVAGFTDSHWLREAFGTIAYGFFPARAMDPELASRLIHSADERVPVVGSRARRSLAAARRAHRLRVREAAARAARAGRRLRGDRGASRRAPPAGPGRRPLPRLRPVAGPAP